MPSERVKAVLHDARAEKTHRPLPTETDAKACGPLTFV